MSNPEIPHAPRPRPTRLLGVTGAIWGVTGILLLLTMAVIRLTGVAADALSYPLTAWHWTALVAHTLFMAQAEGYRGFQKSFAPRVVARAWHLKAHPIARNVLLAPLFCMGYFHATRRRLIGTYALTLAIVALVVAFQAMPQPWRGILDAGVVVGLAWGVASIVVLAARSLARGGIDASPEVPHTPR